MLLFGLAKNKDVVHVGDYDPLISEFLEGVAHHFLEHFWTVHEAKEHDQGFEQLGGGGVVAALHME